MSYLQFLTDQVFITSLAVGVLVVNLLLFIIFILVSSSFFKRITLTSNEAEKIRASARHEADLFIAQSRREALALFEKTNERMARILDDVQASSSLAQQKMAKTYESFMAQEMDRVRKGTQELLASYESAGIAAKSSYQKSADAIDMAVIRQTQEAMNKFQKTLEEEVEKFRASADERFGEWQKQAAQEIDAYKQASFKKIEKSLYQVIALISKEIIGRAVDLEGQQELVLKALEEAKKEGFFKS